MFRPTLRISAPLFLITFLVILLYLTLTIIKEPFIGVELVEGSKGDYFVKALEPAGQAISKGILVGDKILSVNDAPAGQYSNVKKFFSIEKSDSVLVEHSNKDQQLIEFNRGWYGIIPVGNCSFSCTYRLFR
ncbi:PDZ domain-containing protein [Paenibacillus sp. JDR-2]|uniref:PDZ domain-containing protein n=1 Tax=Paenibacillus sp. (strain JDR-2) TaxID=324057 RepID=UPI0001664B95|nr:PDZ domain-containing protein [Paenibacillus sp. JDR-2]ACS99710.1 hypothetical protein Pjdr2_1031 [Paenibacillus sp. JDR-2]